MSYSNFKARCFFGWSGVHFLITVTTVTVIIRSVSIGSSLLFPARNLHSILYRHATSILHQVLKPVVGVMLVVMVMVVVVVVLFGGFVGDEGKRLHNGNDCQKMPQGDDYRYFSKDNSNKADLIRQFRELMKREAPRLLLDYLLVITLEKEACEISLTGVQNLFPCNHKEADTRIIYYYTLEDKPTVVIASDTDTLILMINVFACHLPDQDWFLQTEKNQEASQYLPSRHLSAQIYLQEH